MYHSIKRRLYDAQLKSQGSEKDDDKDSGEDSGDESVEDGHTLD